MSPLVYFEHLLEEVGLIRSVIRCIFHSEVIKATKSDCATSCFSKLSKSRLEYPWLSSYKMSRTNSLWTAAAILLSYQARDVSGNKKFEIPTILKGPIKEVFTIYNALDSLTQNHIALAAMQFGREHDKVKYYDFIVRNNNGLFNVMDKYVMEYCERVNRLYSAKARQYAMLMTVILECGFHLTFEKKSLDHIKPMVLEWAKKYKKLDAWAQKSFKDEFGYLEKELRKISKFS
ncbi:unnamed protein product [Cylicocyclus nassatus]|uniref:Uncharacterized protein n=1 Tax=Cylicocyclus nassatus TaxID=53992 RepID=A0AA36MB14_CYLNA|nr:unnamed protein product [Cylicocyclus nassatus]